ncbi:MAG: site-specific DNA-methyltransferase [Acidobacteriota bacterium]|nr:site-specific DNA-methyltransferase [Acidobacteriota bacterium]
MLPPAEFINRILCDDAREILQKLPSRSIDLIVTDPPYGDNTSYGPRRVRIAGNEHPLLALAILHDAYRLLKNDTTAYMFCGMQHLPFIRSFFDRYTRYRIRDVLIWDKVTMGVGSPFRKQYECILVLEKGRPRYRNKTILNLLSYSRVRESRHPHAKPLPLIKALIAHSSDHGGVVLDSFLGSGTTALAGQQLGRRCIGIEVNPAYCHIAVNRLKQKTLPFGRARAASPARFESLTGHQNAVAAPLHQQDTLW